MAANSLSVPQRYLLPCPQCSRQIAVKPTQAGDPIHCDCGFTNTAPTLAEIKQLEPEPVADTADKPRRRWSVQRGIAFTLGAYLLIAAGLVQWRIAPQRAALDIRQPAFKEINFDVQRLQPLDAWEAWLHFRDQKLEYRATPEYLENRVKYRELSYYLYAGWLAAALGLAAILGAILWPRGR